MSSILYSPEPNKVLDMRLRCLFHGVTIVGKKFSSISEQLKYLREKEFTVLRPEFVKLCTSENLSYTLELMSKMEFPFERSSIFASNDDLREAKIFNLKGFNYRSIHDFKKTVVDKVEFKVLPNGIVIAVVHVDPVMINGHTFNYFTINNEQQLNQINMRLGDELIVYAEENMPPKVLFSYKNGAKAPVKFPKHCSKCKSPLKKVSLSGEDVLMCISHLSCVDESADKIRKFTSAHGLYVPSLTSSIIRDLVDNNLISNAADLLDLFEKGYGEVTFMEKNEYNRISTEIKEAKKCRLENFI